MEQILNSSLFQRFWQFAGAVSVRVKVLGIVIGVIVLLGVFSIYQMRRSMNETLRLDLSQQGHALTEHLESVTGRFVTDGTVGQLQPVLIDFKAHYSNEYHNTLVDYIIITDQNFEPLVSTYTDTIPPALAPDQLRARHQGTGTGLIIADFTLEGSHIIEAGIGYENGAGFAFIGLSEANIQRLVNEVTSQIIIIILVMVAFGFAAAFFLTWILTRPIYDLVDATQAVASGDFTRRVPRWADDEIGELATAFNAMTESLQVADAERAERERLRERYISGVILAQENERQRIARELHDSTSQSLTSLLVGLQTVRAAKTPDELNQRIEDLRGIVGGTLDDVRTIARGLRPTALDDLGLQVALQRHIDDYQQRHKIQVDLAINGLDQRLTSELETTIYRVVQEGLTNIARYAKATQASVIVGQRGDKLRILVEDNGVGFDPEMVRKKSKSLGLQGIRERAALFNGTLRIESQPDHGTTLVVEIPFHDGLKVSTSTESPKKDSE